MKSYKMKMSANSSPSHFLDEFFNIARLRNFSTLLLGCMNLQVMEFGCKSVVLELQVLEFEGKV